MLIPKFYKYKYIINILYKYIYILYFLVFYPERLNTGNFVFFGVECSTEIIGLYRVLCDCMSIIVQESCMNWHVVYVSNKRMYFVTEQQLHA